jgi:hypothetical protein
MPQRSYLFVFDSAKRARDFVRLVASCLHNIALLIEDCHVRVVDGSEEGQHQAIIRLARRSAAQHLRVPRDDGTRS